MDVQNVEELWESGTKSYESGMYNFNLIFEHVSINFIFQDESISKIIDLCADHVDYTVKKSRLDDFVEGLKVTFTNCNFKEGFSFDRNIDQNLEFDVCEFNKGFDVSEIHLNSKMKFRRCKFYETNFYNTSFEDLADFYRCDFFRTVIFLKTDFFGTTVFSASTFHQNVLFTYTLIDKMLILRGTKFYQGVDLSLSIGMGEINCFNINLPYYKGVSIGIDKINYPNDYETVYDNWVTKEGKIPIENSKETFRIFKHVLISQNDFSESLRFKVYENKELSREVRQKPHNVGKALDRFTLCLNRISNYYGSSWGMAFIFILVFGGLFFVVSATGSAKYEVGCPNWVDVSTGLGDFCQFLIPTHKFNYLDGDHTKDVSLRFYVFDFFGRIIVGYGIYQFIQAFRKYR